MTLEPRIIIVIIMLEPRIISHPLMGELGSWDAEKRSSSVI